jgi:hypothetical protein
MFFPDDKNKDMVRTKGITLKESQWAALEETATRLKAKSRNRMIRDFLLFGMDFFPRLARREKRLREIAQAQGWTMAEACAELVELGLSAYEKEGRGRK